jgi:hypothetical protein
VFDEEKETGEVSSENGGNNVRSSEIVDKD